MFKSRKTLSFEDAPGVLRRLRKEGKRIVQCHGTFDLLHPGHIIHFETAKAMGDILVVTVTSDKYVTKGPCRPYFNDELRVKFLTAIESVDYVIVVPFPAAVEAIECVHPHVYCKGKEYEDTRVDITGNIYDDIKTVERLGGEVRYVGSIVFSSTELLQKHFDIHPEGVRKLCKKLSNKYTPNDFKQIVEGFKDLKVLVIGDLIFDRYTTVRVQGLTSKNRIISARFISEETQAGGALAAFRHVREFTPNAKLISIIGTETWVEEELSKYIDPDEDGIVRVPKFTTIIKHRYLEPLREGKELNKLFSVNIIDAQHPGKEVQMLLCSLIANCIGDYDLVIITDFGHGVMQDSIRELVQERAPFLALNCQTNSNNHGFNIISRQYHRADSFSLDETELTLACGRRNINLMEELKSLHQKFSARYSWLTRGEQDTIGIKTGGAECICEPFERRIVDTVGAGDAFCVLASLAAAKDLEIDMATFMGQLAGAQAVRIVGNSECIRKDMFIKGGMNLFSY